MIYVYSVSVEGAYHTKNDMKSQDATMVIKCSDAMAIAVVADGLGSAMFSDIASRIAVEKSSVYCVQNLTKSCSDKKILETISASFLCAQKAIEAKAESEGHDLAQYDTTLTLAILINDILYHGHSGDSGIIVLSTDGLYENVTEQQRDEDSRVFPLFFEDKWVFGRYGKKVASVLLATDGLYETFFPVYLESQPINIHVTLAQFFLDNSYLQINELGEDTVMQRMKEFIQQIPEDKVNDDKSLVVLVNTAVEIVYQCEDYYQEPDWAALIKKYDEEWRRIAYPHLFEQEVIEIEVEDRKAAVKLTSDNSNLTFESDASEAIEPQKKMYDSKDE